MPSITLNVKRIQFFTNIKLTKSLTFYENDDAKKVKKILALAVKHGTITPYTDNPSNCYIKVDISHYDKFEHLVKPELVV